MPIRIVCNSLFNFIVIRISLCIQQGFVMDLGSVHHYLYSLDACTDNLFVVVFGAERTRILALPQKVESATVARSL